MAAECAAYLIPPIPFWRFAVAIKEWPDMAARPFYRRAAAFAWADEVRDLVPHLTVVVLRRTIGGVEVVDAR